MTGLLIAAAIGVAAANAVMSSRASDRLRLVQDRLGETGMFSSARLQLQRNAFERLPPYLGNDDVLVEDIRIQLAQARELGARLPGDILDTVDELSTLLSLPVVARTDLVAAASLLERIVEAETEAHERILRDSLEGVRRDRDIIWGAIVVTVLLALVAIWAAPQRLAAPLRPLIRFWIGGVLEQRRMALRMQRMALAGEAAASLAHELRNPLAGVVMALQNLERDTPEIEPRVRPLVGELERITRTLNDHLGALRGPSEEPTDVEIGSTLTDLAELLRYEAPTGVSIEVGAGSGLVCRTKPDKLRQILLNLGLNAVQALEEGGGRVLFEAERVEDGVLLRVSDTGPGFPPSVRDGTPGPFASTKEGGTGLGLRIVRRAAGELGGTVSLSNGADGGARVEVVVPCSEEATRG